MRMRSKQAEAALIRMVEEGFAHVGQLPPNRLRLLVTGIDTEGSPPKHLKVFATLFFLKGGQPFCCGEPGCHSEMFWASDRRLGEYLRSQMHVEHEVTVEIQTTTVYYEGIQFTAFGKRGGYVECPCCGYRTIDGGPESGQICEVCLWEDLDRKHPDTPSDRHGHNLGLSLNGARSNFLRISACHESYLSSVRPPSEEERNEGKDKIELTGTDEWLLQSIRAASASKGASLAGVIGCGDALNHAIFTPAELRSGFAKLLAARYILEKEGRWFINELDRNPNVIGNSKTFTDPSLGEPGWSYPLSDEDIKKATAEYLQASSTREIE